MKTTNRLRQQYFEQIVPAMKEKFAYSNPMEVPRLLKICVNQGVGAATGDKKMVDAAVHEMTLITGQKAVPTVAKTSISNFKLREGMPIGARLTFGSEIMYEFLDRLVSATLPRVRDFRGISIKGFDGRGNFTMGVTEQIIFPEINIEKVNKITGLDITFVTSAKTDEEALALLTEFGMPFKSGKNA